MKELIIKLIPKSLLDRYAEEQLIPSDIPEKILDIIPPNSLDFVLSTAVFQHFPSKDIPSAFCIFWLN